MTAAVTPVPAAAAAPADATIDVRTIPPRERHPLIFSTFRSLAVGQALELVNDHDPLPLYDHFRAQHPGGFGWDYLERGPSVFRVRISRVASSEAPRPHGGSSCCGSCGGGA